MENQLTEMEDPNDLLWRLAKNGFVLESKKVTYLPVYTESSVYVRVDLPLIVEVVDSRNALGVMESKVGIAVRNGHQAMTMDAGSKFLSEPDTLELVLAERIEQIRGHFSAGGHPSQN